MRYDIEYYFNLFHNFHYTNRDVINGKEGKTAALPKFSDMLTLSQSGGGRLCPPISFASPKKILITPLTYIRNFHRIFIVKNCFQELADLTTTSQPIFVLKSASKDLPQFIEHPRNSYIVRGHSALLRCKVIHADKAYFSCNGEAMAASELHKEVDKVEISETASMEPFNVKTLTLQLNRINIEEFFGLYTCRCDAWSTKGMTSSTNATVETACKLDF